MTIKNRRAVEIRVGELRDQGLTMREVAAEVGVSLGSVYNILRQLEDEEDARMRKVAEKWGEEYTPMGRPSVKQVNEMRRRRRERNQDV